MMLANEVHSTCLWAKLSLFLNKPHLGTNLQLGEVLVHQTVSMEINQPTVRGLDLP